jgi:molecular chaperone DnaJ
MKNYYEILGVDETATQDEIKKAYRQLSKQYHPDVNPEGEEKFKDIAEAYDIIGDKDKREDYNQKKNNPFANMGGSGFDIHDMFEHMVNNQRQTRKAPDKIIDFEITPVESYFGVKKDIDFEILNNCGGCNGSGGDREICHSCNGHGFIIRNFGTGMFQQQVQMACQTCQGAGSQIKTPCNVCNGNGRKKEKQKLSVSIPPNADDGDFMRVKNKGDYYAQINSHGDLLLKIVMSENSTYQKSGMDLIYNKKLDAIEMLLSNTMDIEHPDGTLRISAPKNMDTEKPLRIPNKGYRTNHGNGNFYIKLSVSKGEEISDEVKNKIKELLKQTDNITN